METSVLMSGPIRPSEDAVLYVIASVRRQFPGARLFLSTWTESPAIRAAVDVYQAVPEPSDEEVLQSVTSRTIQHRELQLPDTTPGGVLSTYRMLYGVQCVCQLAAPSLSDSSRVVRIRTDSVLEIEPSYLRALRAAAPEYLAKKGDGLDWFAMTTFGVLKATWCFQSLEEYNQAIAAAWNPEVLISRRVPVPISYLDPRRVEAYILREGGRKHYYP